VVSRKLVAHSVIETGENRSGSPSKWITLDAFLSVRTDAADPMSLITAIRDEIKSLDPELPVSQVGTLESRFSTAVAQPRFRTTLIASFAALALVLAVVGTYGVISYSVTQRTHEIGIRVDLGAPRKSVLKLVLVQGTALAIDGVLIGLGRVFRAYRLAEQSPFQCERHRLADVRRNDLAALRNRAARLLFPCSTRDPC
jgi:predicted lysophospholipase L1 biosynthesis ABC-type transport system permease subunit